MRYTVWHGRKKDGFVWQSRCPTNSFSPSLKKACHNGSKVPAVNVRYAPDCVAKLFLGVRTKFSRGAGAPILKSRGGSHDQSDFQPAACVSSLQGIGLPKTRFDGHAAKFCRHLIFEFCNTIPPKADIGRRYSHVRFRPIAETRTHPFALNLQDR